MAVQLVTIAESDFSSGADSSSAESNIKETFVQEAKNCIPDMGGSIFTRKGYITYGGGIPFRVLSAEPMDKKIRLTLDRAVNVASLARQPVMVYGRTGYTYMADGFPISELSSTTDQWTYITEPTTDIPSVVPNMTSESDPAGTVTLEAFKTGFTQRDVIIGIAQTALGSPVSSVMTLNTERVNLDPSTLTLTSKFVNYTGVSKYFYIYYIDPIALNEPSIAENFMSGSSWVMDTSGGSLNNNNFLIRCYNLAGDVILPDTLNFDDITGAIVAEFNTPVAGRMLVTTANTEDFYDIAVPPNNYASIPIEREIDADVVIVDVYKQVGNEFTMVCPQSITFDASAQYPLSILVENPSLTESVSLRVFWKKAEQAARSVITIPIAGDCTGQPIDYEPQLSIYGPDHSEVYAAGSGSRPGWASHIDRYRTANTDRMITALGYNMFHELPVLPTEDHYIKHYINLRSRSLVSGTIEIGPALSSGQARTTANIVASTVSAQNTLNASVITQVAELVTFTTTLSGTLTGNLADLGTHVTVLQAPCSDLYGEHEIVSITGDVVGPNISSISITIRVPRGADIDYSKYSGIPIEWGIFTDVIELGSASKLIPGDRVFLSGFESTYTNTEVVSAYQVGSKYYLCVKGIVALRQIPNRMLIIGQRTTNLIPLRDYYESGLNNYDIKIIPGDMLFISNIQAEQRVCAVTVNLPQELAIPPVATVVDGECIVSADLAGSYLTINAFKVGDLVSFTNCGIYSGEYEIGVIDSSTQFSTKAKAMNRGDETVTLTNGWLNGSLVEVVGEPITIIDSLTNANSVTVPRRWVTVESPTTKTYVKQFSEATYTEQPFVRSVMAQDSLYLTNGIDPVWKYDGFNYTKAGLPRWNPYVFVTKNPSAAGKLLMPTATATTDSVVVQPVIGEWTSFYAQAGNGSQFSYGDAVKISGGTDTGSTIVAIDKSVKVTAPDGKEILVDIIQVSVGLDKTGVSTTLPTTGIELVYSKIVYKYYFRLNLIDSNLDTSLSASLGSQDVVVNLTEDASIEFRLVGLPMLEQVDFSRLELEVYRTARNENAPFYRVMNVEVPYPILDYIDITDSMNDASLSDLDYTSSVMESQELINGIMPPPVARCITTSNNRLLLGATTSSPVVNLTFTDGTQAYATEIDDFIGIGLELVSGLTSYRFVWTNTEQVDWAPSDIVVASGVATVTCTDTTGLAEGKWIYMTRTTAATGPSLKFAGWHKIVEVVDGTSYTFACPTLDDSVTFDASNDADTVIGDVFTYDDANAVPVYTGEDDWFRQTMEGNTAYPLIRCPSRMGIAINAIASLDSDSLFWAEYANDVAPLGSLAIRFSNPASSVQFISPIGSTGMKGRVYVDGILLPFADRFTTINESKTVFRGSRIVRSYPKHPEAFDNPDGQSAAVGSSIIDVNPADGEIITALMPLIGPSTSSSSQLQGIVIAFKERSIYAVDIEAGTFEKLETNGIGTPYPNSVAYTKSGLAFASESGIYRLDRTLKITKVSGNVGRQWNDYDLSDINNFHGHHTAKDSQYKISTPSNNVLVYNYEREVEGKPGAWCEYTNYPVAGGWANQGNLEFFASTLGRVFVNRNTGTVTDYRDDSNTGINFDVKFRPMHFGDPAIRKQVRHVNMSFRNTAQLNDSIDVSCAFDCSTDFTSLDGFQTEVSANATISAIRFGVPTGRLTYLQLRVQSVTIDEPIEVAGITYKVAGLQVAGTEEAKTSKRTN